MPEPDNLIEYLITLFAAMTKDSSVYIFVTDTYLSLTLTLLWLMEG